MKLFIGGVAVMLIGVGVSICIDMSNLIGPGETDKNQESLEGMVNFSIQEIIVTNELEIYDFWRDENKIETSLDSKFVIISMVIENNIKKWVAVESVFDGLTDNEGNKYSAEMYIEINGSVYTTQQITFIGEDESFGLGVYISPNSTVEKKIVFSIPIEREPEELKLNCCLTSDEFTNEVDWYTIELEIPS